MSAKRRLLITLSVVVRPSVCPNCFFFLLKNHLSASPFHPSIPKKNYIWNFIVHAKGFYNILEFWIWRCSFQYIVFLYIMSNYSFKSVKSFKKRRMSSFLRGKKSSCASCFGAIPEIRSHFCKCFFLDYICILILYFTIQQEFCSSIRSNFGSLIAYVSFGTIYSSLYFFFAIK